MNEERAIRLLSNRWDPGLLAMIGWSLVLHVVAGAGVLALLPLAKARGSRDIPAYTVELASLGPHQSAKPVSGVPGEEFKSLRGSPPAGASREARPKPNVAAPVPAPPPVPQKQAEATPEPVKDESAETKKTVEPTETVAARTAEPEKPKPEPEKPKPERVATTEKSRAEEHVPVKDKSKPEATVKAEATKEPEKISASVKPDAAAKPKAPTEENVVREKKAESPTKTAPQKKQVAGAAVTDGATKGSPANQDKNAGADTAVAAEGDAAVVDDPRYAAAIENIRRRVEGGGAGLGGEGGGQVATAGEGSGVGGGDRVVGTEFLIYYNIMLSRIKQAWVWVGHDQSLSVTVRFAIEADGEIRNVKLNRSSGDASYDESVIQAVQRVNPLPAPPATYRRDFSQVELTFRPGDLRQPS
jgi:colicin import membrane protein